MDTSSSPNRKTAYERDTKPFDRAAVEARLSKKPTKKKRVDTTEKRTKITSINRVLREGKPVDSKKPEDYEFFDGLQQALKVGDRVYTAEEFRESPKRVHTWNTGRIVKLNLHNAEVLRDIKNTADGSVTQVTKRILYCNMIKI